MAHWRDVSSLETENSRKAGGDDYIRGAAAGPETPLSPFSTGQNPRSPAPLFAAARPVLPFQLQPCLYGSLAASRGEIRVPPPQKQNNVQSAHTIVCFDAKVPFYSAQNRQRFGGRRSDVNEVCLCRYVHVEMRAATRSLNWFRPRRGRFWFCTLNQKDDFATVIKAIYFECK